ncbi:malate dehydrogenase (quinone) [Arachidicoccus rhizosphaerae]|jgi:malate dehydrogenase (quinone)|uniref:Probable malate:quinone oxidoreductase n=1 Tax=Arachidicoccus rhizosphaerae TaxID=551991 RepID=A0A1H3VT37_9BACT|nr:malate:quinone oxidoreductase [Arachidicoccus rhizosphaerae]SDZ77248.1 malate dehydrogenase (quinone) [Arachidicoccus rhizosphaerae]
MNSNSNPDIILIGAGIMSATLGSMLNQLMPSATIEIYERLNQIAQESSDAWNNAGTGHSALCELNYTPELADGTIDATKALRVAEQFELSKQYWAYLSESKLLKDPKDFISPIPHMSFVWGSENVSFLKKRYDKLQTYNLFKGMQFSDNQEQLKKWIPLIMQDRDPSQPVAATKMDIGTDVNFGSLARQMIEYLSHTAGVKLFTGQEVTNLKKQSDGSWQLKIKDLASGEIKKTTAKFVFIGAGGGALPLLEKSKIPEGKGFGGFPASGQWLRCTNPDIIKQHEAKVYGKPAVGAPPMSDPHLDTRMINGERALLFGPFAGFSSKFLKNGSYWDLPLSIKWSNLWPMIKVGLTNFALLKYLIQQIKQSPADRVNALRKFYINADGKDWELEIAGQRVQVIKKDPKKGGILQFGTEVVTSADGSISALLGASPGASTSVPIMLELIQRCFPKEFQSEAWQSKLKKMVPTFGESLEKRPDLCQQMRSWTSEALQLNREIA